MDISHLFSLFVYIFTKMMFIIVGLFPVLNPPGHAPIFLMLTEHERAIERVILAKKVGLNSFLVIAVSMLVGGKILDLFDIAIPFVQVAGGILLCRLSWNMLSGHHDVEKKQERAKKIPRSQILSQQAFFPLTFPITVGPGSLTISIVLAANMQAQMTNIQDSISIVIACFIALVLISLSIYWCYRYAEKILKFLGPTGNSVFFRLSAFILLCLAVHIIWDGLSVLTLSFIQDHFPDIHVVTNVA